MKFFGAVFWCKNVVAGFEGLISVDGMKNGVLVVWDGVSVRIFKGKNVI